MKIPRMAYNAILVLKQQKLSCKTGENINTDTIHIKYAVN